MPNTLVFPYQFWAREFDETVMIKYSSTCFSRRKVSPIHVANAMRKFSNLVKPSMTKAAKYANYRTIFMLVTFVIGVIAIIITSVASGNWLWGFLTLGFFLFFSSLVASYLKEIIN